MGWSADARDGMLGQVRGRISHLSIHTADPGATGANEVASGAYARVAASGADFTAASGGSFTLGADKAFVAAAAETATHFGAWESTTFLGGGSITGDQAFNAEGDYTLKTGTSFTLT
jgi:hypothetical protein